MRDARVFTNDERWYLRMIYRPTLFFLLKVFSFWLNLLTIRAPLIFKTIQWLIFFHVSSWRCRCCSCTSHIAHTILFWQLRQHSESCCDCVRDVTWSNANQNNYNLQSRTTELANTILLGLEFLCRGCRVTGSRCSFCRRSVLITQLKNIIFFFLVLRRLILGTNDFHYCLYNGKRWRAGIDAQSHLTQYAWAKYFFFSLIDLLCEEVRITCYFVVFFCVLFWIIEYKHQLGSRTFHVIPNKSKGIFYNLQMNWICLCG